VRGERYRARPSTACESGTSHEMAEAREAKARRAVVWGGTSKERVRPPQYRHPYTYASTRSSVTAAKSQPEARPCDTAVSDRAGSRPSRERALRRFQKSALFGFEAMSAPAPRHRDELLSRRSLSRRASSST
jgi:hypothetical protein